MIDSRQPADIDQHQPARGIGPAESSVGGGSEIDAGLVEDRRVVIRLTQPTAVAAIKAVGAATTGHAVVIDRRDGRFGAISWQRGGPVGSVGKGPAGMITASLKERQPSMLIEQII